MRAQTRWKGLLHCHVESPCCAWDLISVVSSSVSHPTASPPEWALVYCGCPAGTHQCAPEPRMTLEQSAISCCVGGAVVCGVRKRSRGVSVSQQKNSNKKHKPNPALLVKFGGQLRFLGWCRFLPPLLVAGAAFPSSPCGWYSDFKGKPSK